MRSPPPISVESVARAKGNPGAPTKFYKLAAKSANSAKHEDSCGSASDSLNAKYGEVCEVGSTSFRTVRTVRNEVDPPESRANAHSSHNSHGGANAQDVEIF